VIHNVSVGRVTLALFPLVGVAILYDAICNEYFLIVDFFFIYEKMQGKVVSRDISEENTATTKR
jgi:hypothetical protein